MENNTPDTAIEQDFGYLADAVNYTFEMIRSGLYHIPLNDADRVTWSLLATVVADTYARSNSGGQLPMDRYREALEDRDPFGRRPFNMDRWVELYLLDVRAIAIQLSASGGAETGVRLDELRKHITQWPAQNVQDPERALVAGAKQRLCVCIEAVKQEIIAAANSTATTATAKTPKRKSAVPPEVPTLADKFATVEGALDKWMNLLRAEGIVDVNGRFAMAPGAKGKGKLIAAWTAASEVFSLPGYATDTQLVQALVAHLPGLSGLDRVGKVRNGKTYPDTVTRYKEILQDD